MSRSVILLGSLVPMPGLRRRNAAAMWNKASLCAALVTVVCLAPGMAPAEGVYPDKEWASRSPSDVGLDRAQLDAIADYLQGRGCIVRHGYLVYSWGDMTERGDVASALKPWISHFVFKAVEEGRLGGLDAKVGDFQPWLNDLNAALGYKDRQITFRHMANQISCYGVSELPGAAFDYNDWQTALLFDTLFCRVYGSTLESVDTKVLHPLLTDLLGCQDDPTFLAFGVDDRPGRLGVSPRDFARFGLLYLHGGNWRGQQILREDLVRLAVSSPLPNSIPRTSAQQAEMCPGQRTIGSQRIPDNQTDHQGSYSWFWWLNGIDREGRRHWPDAPAETFAALGHANGMRGMAVVPSLDAVLSWNETRLGDLPEEPDPLNEVFRLLKSGDTTPISQE